MQKNQLRFDNPSDRKNYLKWARAIPPSRCIKYVLDERHGDVVIYLEGRRGPVCLVRDLSPFDLRWQRGEIGQQHFITSRAARDIARVENWRGYVAEIIYEMRACRSKAIKNKNSAAN